MFRSQVRSYARMKWGSEDAWKLSSLAASVKLQARLLRHRRGLAYA